MSQEHMCDIIDVWGGEVTQTPGVKVPGCNQGIKVPAWRNQGIKVPAWHNKASGVRGGGQICVGAIRCVGRGGSHAAES